MRVFHKFLVSLKTAVFLLALLSCLSIVGTLIPQEQESSDIRRQFPRAGNWILLLGFDDLYHSPPFVGALGLLSLCTLACTLTRLKLTRRRLFHRLEKVGVAEIRSFPVSREIHGVEDPSRLGQGWTRRDFEDGVSIFLRLHGRAALIGGLLIHIGLLIILSGGLWGSQVSVETAIRGMEGESLPLAPLEAVKAAQEADRLRRWGRRIQSENPEDPRLDGFRKHLEKLDEQYHKGLASPAFKLKVEKLWIDEHLPAIPGEPPQTSNWNSRVTVVESGRDVASAVIRVNEPFSWGSYTFFQADWTKKYRSIRVEVSASDSAMVSSEPSNVSAKAASSSSPLTTSSSASAALLSAPASPSISLSRNTPRVISMPVGRPIKPDWCPFSLVVLDFFPDFKIMGEEFVSVSDELRNPAARIEAYDKDGKSIGRSWAFSRQLTEMSGHFSKLPYRFVVIDAEPAYETGLQVTSNPSVPVVWFGCILMTIGLFLSFYVTYREEWAVLKPDGKMILAVGGNRPPTMLASTLDHLVETVLHAPDLPSEQPPDLPSDQSSALPPDPPSAPPS